MDSDTRFVYNQQLQAALIDAMDDYTGQPLSKWLVGHEMGRNEDPYEERALFVVKSLRLPLFRLPEMVQALARSIFGLHRTTGGI